MSDKKRRVDRVKGWGTYGTVSSFDHTQLCEYFME